MITMKDVLLRSEKDLAPETKVVPSPIDHRQEILHESAFAQMIRLERRRVERSGRQFILVLFRGDCLCQTDGNSAITEIAAAITSGTRETDLLGWYEPSTLGLLMTEIGSVDRTTIDLVANKLSAHMHQAVGAETCAKLDIIIRIFPEDIEILSGGEGMPVFYPDLQVRHERKRWLRRAKRLIDIVGSLLAFLLFLPAFLLIGLLVKLTSAGPILFCQKRVGQYGKEFTFYKFRTMYADNDSQIHREFVEMLIAGRGEAVQGKKVYKLTNDPRITPLGRILRKLSLDELPQFANVLMNQMSLVGPRPPIPYEYERYKTWHKRRVLELKPGLTGLWQVKGRSRTTFDQMVRMDLTYSKKESIWVDLKIILQTPAAMLFGRGAC
jgi:lipopolysaccharide/colanic/teichoic acid biosynthesis glycosyltransferase